MKRGFTVVELLMVVAIIAILLSFTVTATTGAIRRARDEQASACVLAVNQGIAVYYAVNGKWPGPMGDKAESVVRTENEDADYYELRADEVRETVKELVQQAHDGTPVMDISGLFVSRHSGEGSKDFGMDFLTAIHGTKQNPKKMTMAEMYFGYPDSNGHFKRFHAKYYPKSDQLIFSK